MLGIPDQTHGLGGFEGVRMLMAVDNVQILVLRGSGSVMEENSKAISLLLLRNDRVNTAYVVVVDSLPFPLSGSLENRDLLHKNILTFTNVKCSGYL